jgi:hypothetical protein
LVDGRVRDVEARPGSDDEEVDFVHSPESTDGHMNRLPVCPSVVSPRSRRGARSLGAAPRGESPQ